MGEIFPVINHYFYKLAFQHHGQEVHDMLHEQHNIFNYFLLTIISIQELQIKQYFGQGKSFCLKGSLTPKNWYSTARPSHLAILCIFVTSKQLLWLNLLTTFSYTKEINFRLTSPTTSCSVDTDLLLFLHYLSSVILQQGVS